MQHLDGDAQRPNPGPTQPIEREVFHRRAALGKYSSNIGWHPCPSPEGKAILQDFIVFAVIPLSH